MRRLCPTRFCLVLGAVLVASLASGCGVINSDPTLTATPSRAQGIGIEIAESYEQLLFETRAIVEPRPSALDAKERLRRLREEYKLRFANYACLGDSLDDAEQAEIAASFDAARAAFVVADMAWFEDAASDYDFEDPAIREGMEDTRYWTTTRSLSALRSRAPARNCSAAANRPALAGRVAPRAGVDR